MGARAGRIDVIRPAQHITRWKYMFIFFDVLSVFLLSNPLAGSLRPTLDGPATCSTESANAQLESEIVAQATEIKNLLTNQDRGTILISRKTVGPFGTKLGG